MRRRTALMAAGLAVLILPPCEAAAHDMPAHAARGVPRIVAPANGAVVQGPVKLRFRTAAAPSRAAGHAHLPGHIHLLIDSAPPAPGEPVPVDDTHVHFMGGETAAVLELPPGRHTLQLIVAGADHVPANPPVVSNKVTVTVQPAVGAAARHRH